MQIAFWISKPERLIIAIYSCYCLALFFLATLKIIPVLFLSVPISWEFLTADILLGSYTSFFKEEKMSVQSCSSPLSLLLPSAINF